jgi:hypothetical protein
MSDLLEQIQALQFSDKQAAEKLLLTFVRETFPLDVDRVELRPLAVSLNSFNGFLTLTNGQRLFFKTHTEPGGVIGEYYNAAQLADAGYPVLQPLYSSTEAGKQFLIYEVITDPSVFDVAWAIERGDERDISSLAQAQAQSDAELLEIYLNTLVDQTSDEAAKAPVHQLFYHRLTGGRLEQFYGDKTRNVALRLPDGEMSMNEVRRVKWTINGQHYDETLDEIIERAKMLLEPKQAGASVVGHGDAHNGNLFFQKHDDGYQLLYFDPAFAGRHSPLLDLTKPLFHNVFAMWMYFPDEKRAPLALNLTRDLERWQISHNYMLHPIRKMFLESKVQRILIPILQELKMRNWLAENWRETLKSALFCCPFLTMSLTDSAKFSPEISLLGLAMAVEMGSESISARSEIDRTLDEVESILK